MKNGLSTTTLDQLLTSALTGQLYNQRRLYNQAMRYARRISMQRARGLPEDLHEEIAQQAFADLWQAKTKALVGKTAQQAFRQCILKAIRIVQAAYAPAGQRTRAYKDNGPEKVAPEHISSVRSAGPVRHSSSEGLASAQADGATLPGSMVSDDQGALEARIDVGAILASASPMVRAALQMIYMEATPLGQVANQFNVSRFSLTRKIDQFCLTWREAA